MCIFEFIRIQLDVQSSSAEDDAVAESESRRRPVLCHVSDASDTQAIMIQLENLKLNLLFSCIFPVMTHQTRTTIPFSIIFLLFLIILGVTVAAAVRRGIQVPAQSYQCQDLQALADTNSRSNIISRPGAACPGDSDRDRGPCGPARRASSCGPCQSSISNTAKNTRYLYMTISASESWIFDPTSWSRHGTRTQVKMLR
jgi:hypothetical protein